MRVANLPPKPADAIPISSLSSPTLHEPAILSTPERALFTHGHPIHERGKQAKPVDRARLTTPSPPNPRFLPHTHIHTYTYAHTYTPYRTIAVCLVLSRATGLRCYFSFLPPTSGNSTGTSEFARWTCSFSFLTTTATTTTAHARPATITATAKKKKLPCLDATKTFV